MYLFYYLFGCINGYNKIGDYDLIIEYILVYVLDIIRYRVYLVIIFLNK